MKTILSSLLAMLCALLAPAAGAQSCTPAITFGSLIAAVRVGYGDGRLQVGTLYAVCLPKPEVRGNSNFPYDPDAGGKLTTQVKSADGTVLNTYVWYAENISSIWEMSRYKVVGGEQSVKPLAAGDYTLEFAVEGRPFQRFAFSVAAVSSDDPYQPPGNRYFIDGAWSEYGNLFYQRNDPQSSITFTTWVQDRSARATQRSVPYEIKLVRSKDGQVIADDAGTLRLEPRWLTAGLYFRPTGGDRNAFFKAAEFLREDGAYRIRLTVDGRLYGEYPFAVKNGKIAFQGRQIRESTDPLDYITEHISGGRYSSWWLRRGSKP